MKSLKGIAKAKIAIRPRGSQAFLVTLAVVGGVSVVSGFGLLALGRPGGVAATTIGVSILVAACIGWLLSHREADLDGAHATTIVDQSSGVSVSTDSRVIAAPASIRGLAQLFEALAHRKPLPEPDGLVDAEGRPIPDSKETAVAEVQKINEELQEQTMSTIRQLAGDDPGVAQEQPQPLKPPIDSEAGSLNLPERDVDDER